MKVGRHTFISLRFLSKALTPFPLRFSLVIITFGLLISIGFSIHEARACYRIEGIWIYSCGCHPLPYKVDVCSGGYSSGYKNCWEGQFLLCRGPGGEECFDNNVAAWGICREPGPIPYKKEALTLPPQGNSTDSHFPLLIKGGDTCGK